jgi:hypothetical protein
MAMAVEGRIVHSRLHHFRSASCRPFIHGTVFAIGWQLMYRSLAQFRNVTGAIEKA